MKFAEILKIVVETFENAIPRSKDIGIKNCQGRYNKDGTHVDRKHYKGSKPHTHKK